MEVGATERGTGLGRSDDGFHLGDFTSETTMRPSRTND